MSKEMYLGDGAYVKDDGYGQIMLYTHDGVGISNKVYLEQDAMKKLNMFVKELWENKDE